MGGSLCSLQAEDIRAIIARAPSMRAVVLFLAVALWPHQSTAAAIAPPWPLQRQNGATPMPASSSDQQPAPTKAVRLIFEYEGDQVRLISQQPVDVAVTGADIVQTDHPGFYVDS